MIITIPQRILLSILLLVGAGVWDYHLSHEIHSTIIYYIPILFFSFNEKLKLWHTILFAVFSTFVWGSIDYYTNNYETGNYWLLNVTTRFILFCFAAYVCNRYFVEKKLRKRVAEQRRSLAESNAHLKQANDELNKFVGMAAHDIRNPVGAIQMTTEMMLEDEALNAETKEFLEMIHSAASSSLLILNDTLNISKIQSGTIELKRKEYEYIQFVKECIAQNKHLAENKKQSINLITEIPALMLVFDKSRLSQVMNNLLTNAIKYSEKHKAITVKISYADADQKELLTEVIDNGLGIDEKFHATLFDPFTTTSNKPTANESKTGLGLSIVKKIVELHKGTIGFRSEKGKGSDFFFSLPV